MWTDTRDRDERYSLPVTKQLHDHLAEVMTIVLHGPKVSQAGYSKLVDMSENVDVNVASYSPSIQWG